METLNTNTITCLKIDPSNRISINRIVIDLPANKNYNKLGYEDRRAIVYNNMSEKCGSGNIVKNVAKAIFPDESYYHAFFEAITDSSGKKLNKVATRLISNIYNTDNINKISAVNVKCYGNCYILHADSYFNLYDVGADTFINQYNKVYTLSGTMHRTYANRVFKNPGENKCYIYNENANKSTCLIM